MNQAQQSNKQDQMIAKCWSDDSFKQQLLADPVATLKAEGFEFPAGVSVKVLENTAEVIHLVLPVRATELSDADLDAVAGGGSRHSHNFVFNF